MRRPAVRFHLVFWLAFAATVLPSATSAQAAQPQQQPNILLCLADDWGWPQATAYGDKVVKTPTFDRLAREGVLFNNAFAAAPTCTASRASLLTGLAPHQLEQGANLNGALLKKFTTYPDLLEAAGYRVGYTRKGWGPGGLDGSGRDRNPAGAEFRDFAGFLERVPAAAPFCFWFGSRDPHRSYDAGSGARTGMRAEDVSLPPFLPDTPAVRSDLLDYYFAIERFDREVGQLLALLEKAGTLDNTIVIMTSDNGFPFPRAKATCYDAGTHVPLAVRWPARIAGGRTVDDFVSLTDLAPTLLEAAGARVPSEMTGRSFWDLLVSRPSGRIDPRRNHVFTERERHVVSRPAGKSYPIRAVRTEQFHYLRNLRPDLAPVGEEDFVNNPVGAFGDVDNSPSKTDILEHRHEPAIAPYFQAAFGRRPAEELYDVTQDPGEMHNLAGDTAHAETVKQLRGKLDRWMTETKDPRAQGETDLWDR